MKENRGCCERLTGDLQPSKGGLSLLDHVCALREEGTELIQMITDSWDSL